MTLLNYIVAFIISLVVTLIATPLVKMLAIKIGAVDKPDQRKVHEGLMPRLGGLAIFIGSAAGYLYLAPKSHLLPSILLGALIIVVVGILDDKYTISAKWKLLGQLIAAIVVVFSGLDIDFITFPFGERIELGIWGYILAIIWIVGVTNAINLIDGLDGLAAGVSTIALSTILVMATINNQILAIALCVILIGSTVGFLFFNFHPAKIFMGDTGALFLGYSISVISILGLFKSVTLFSLIIPVIILAVPLFDTFFAIIRRILRKQSISAPDKSHLHHCLLGLGFSHRTTVLIIYFISLVFGISAVVFSSSTLWGSFLILFLILIFGQLTAEIVGLIGNKKTPILDMLKLSLTKLNVKARSK